MTQASPLLAFPGLIKPRFVPLVRLGASGGLLGASAGPWLKVRSLCLPLARLKCLGSLPASVHRLGVLDRFFGSANPLQVPERLLQLGPPIVLIRFKGHSHRRLAAAAPVLDLRPVGH